MSMPSLAAECGLTHTVVRTTSELDALAPAWADLLARSACNEPMLSPTWLRAWWRIFGPLGRRELCCVLFHEHDRLVGLAPLLRRTHWYRPGLPYRRIEPLGAGEREADAICSDYLNVIVERGYEPDVARSLAQSLLAGCLGPWDEFLVPMMDGDGPMPGLLAQAFRSEGVTAELTATGAAPYASLPATWEQYLANLPKKKRYYVLRAERDFLTWAGSAVHYQVARTVAELEEGKRILHSLHQERWNADEKRGRFHSSRFLAFHDAVMPDLLRLSALELLWLCVGTEPVAAQYNLTWNNKTTFYQCGRKADLPHGVRPGSVLLHYAIRRAIHAGRREFDFLNGLATYKMQLATATRPIVQVRAVRAAGRESLRCRFEAAVADTRSFRKSLRAVTRRFWPRANFRATPPGHSGHDPDRF